MVDRLFLQKYNILVKSTGVYNIIVTR